MKIIVTWCDEQQAFIVSANDICLTICPTPEIAILANKLVDDSTPALFNQLEIEYSERTWGIILEMWHISESNEALNVLKEVVSALVEFYPEELRSLYRDGIYHDYPIAMDIEGTCFITSSRV